MVEQGEEGEGTGASDTSPSPELYTLREGSQQVIALCELINSIEDWSANTENATLQQYASKVHDRWHAAETVVRTRTLEMCRQDINVCYADILRAIDKWVEGTYGDASPKS